MRIRFRSSAVRCAALASVVSVALLAAACGGSSGDEPATAATSLGTDVSAAEVAVPATGGAGSAPTTTGAATTATAGTGTGATATSEPAAASSMAPAVTGAKGRLVEVRYAGGEVAGGVKRVSIDLDEEVTLVVHSDVADEVHLHGYDESVDVEAGGSATLAFTADIPGVFEVELEGLAVPLAELEVS
ncbi:MAG: hypothetical protein OEY23_21870 [Acidimicrobiia bacterium]|nr:hypothetical protein [Acidimicrobiia bacterium]